jgi:hypothetical protein
MQSGKFSYAGIAGAVAGIVGLFGIYANWFSLSGPNVTVQLNGTADASGKLALAMSIALFAFSVAYVVIDDARIRRSMAALIIVTAVLLTLSVVWAITRADGLNTEVGLWLTGIAGVLGIGAGILTLKESPVDEDIVEDGVAETPEASAPESVTETAPADVSTGATS